MFSNQSLLQMWTKWTDNVLCFVYFIHRIGQHNWLFANTVVNDRNMCRLHSSMLLHNTHKFQYTYFQKTGICIYIIRKKYKNVCRSKSVDTRIKIAYPKVFYISNVPKFAILNTLFRINTKSITSIHFENILMT